LDHCDDIGPLLSAYSDGELAPLQTDQVTRHLDGCERCKETLLDFLLLGHHLRSAVPMPTLDGFSERVLDGLAGSPHPMRQRLSSWFEELREGWIQVVSLAGTAVALATLTLLLAAPVRLHELSAWLRGVHNVEVTQASEPGGSQTFISRLEATPPNVAMWSEPYNKTTVIWLGDDSSGND
jgi:anti-sigma factor RsiW